MMKKKVKRKLFWRSNYDGKKKRKNRKKRQRKLRDKDLVHTFDTLQNFQYLKSKSGIDLFPPSCTETFPI